MAQSVSVLCISRNNYFYSRVANCIIFFVMALKQEEQIKKAISTYLKLQYPKVIYRWDIGADIKLHIGSARKSKSIHKHDKGYPDLQIIEPSKNYYGFFLEVKTDYSKVYKKNGELKADPHVREQADFLDRLRKKGYYAEFGLGLDDCINKINEYLLG